MPSLGAECCIFYQHADGVRGNITTKNKMDDSSAVLVAGCAELPVKI